MGQDNPKDEDWWDLFPFFPAPQKGSKIKDRVKMVRTEFDPLA
jgi:hypothetical protein